MGVYPNRQESSPRAGGCGEWPTTVISVSNWPDWNQKSDSPVSPSTARKHEPPTRYFGRARRRPPARNLPDATRVSQHSVAALRANFVNRPSRLTWTPRASLTSSGSRDTSKRQAVFDLAEHDCRRPVNDRFHTPCPVVGLTFACRRQGRRGAHLNSRPAVTLLRFRAWTPPSRRRVLRDLIQPSRGDCPGTGVARHRGQGRSGDDRL